MAHLLSYECESAEWVTVNTGNDNIWPDSQTVNQETSETVTVCQDEWNTASHRPALCNHGHTGDFDNWILHLDYFVPIISRHEERRCRTSPTCSSAQCGRSETRWTSELTDFPAPSIQVEIDIRLQWFRELILSNCRPSSLYKLCTKYTLHSYICLQLRKKISLKIGLGPPTRCQITF